VTYVCREVKRSLTQGQRTVTEVSSVIITVVNKITSPYRAVNSDSARHHTGHTILATPRSLQLMCSYMFIVVYLLVTREWSAGFVMPVY
jgi:hypothetical protein